MESEAIERILNTATLNYFDITKGSSMLMMQQVCGLPMDGQFTN